MDPTALCSSQILRSLYSNVPYTSNPDMIASPFPKNAFPENTIARQEQEHTIYTARAEEHPSGNYVQPNHYVRPQSPFTGNLTPLAFVNKNDNGTLAQESAEATHQAEYLIHVDPLEESFHDPGYDTDSVGRASVSLASSIRAYPVENGRRYHAFREGIYNFPNDDSEQDREDLKHQMVLNLLGVLHFAPLGPYPQNVIDLCTGTGLWAINMADQYPSANVMGVDLSPIQPFWIPANLKFMVDDVESRWLAPPNHYQYIHSRHTVMAIRDWPLLMDNCYTHLQPGGWFELQEIHHFPQCDDGTMSADWPIAKFFGRVTEGLNALGVNLDGTLSLADKMRDAGFVNVTERIFNVPIGRWPKNRVLKEIGKYWSTILCEGCLPIALGPLTRGLKWSRAEVEAFVIEVKKAYQDGMKDRKVHAYMPMYIVYGQKPMEDINMA